MKAIIEKANDLNELAIFLANMNQQKETHIGFCGEKSEEIHETLKEDFVDQDGDVKFWITRNDLGEIAAAIGLDVDGVTGEVWGPFNQTASMKLQQTLWEQLLYENSTVKKFLFFINQENTQQQKFMNELEIEKDGEHLSLEIKKEDFNQVQQMKSIPFVQSDFQAFQKIHDETFPNTYYDAETIRDRLSRKNILRVLKSESGKLQGYAYFEVDTEMKEASLEYIGVSSDFQNKGIGTTLLKETLSEMFTYPEINKILLTVDHENDQANHIYHKAGFKTRNVLISYCLTC